MNWTREQLKSNAKLMVKKNWVMCAIVSFIMMLLGGTNSGAGTNLNLNFSGDPEQQFSSAVENITGNVGGTWASWALRFAPLLVAVTFTIVLIAIAIDVFAGNPLRVGGSRFYLHNIHSMGEINDLGFAFRNEYGNVVKTMLIRDISIFLWSLLLIIPGIIKSYEYRMVPYLLADNPELESREAMGRSRDMMYGEKMNAFILDLSFILWDFLSALTLGIVGVIWVNPYRDATNAELYMALTAKNAGYQETY